MNKDGWFFVKVDGEFFSGDKDLIWVIGECQLRIKEVDRGLFECVRIVDDVSGEILFEHHMSGEEYGSLEELEEDWKEF